MEKPDKTEKQTKRRSRVGIVLLVILLLLAGTAGYLYYSAVKSPLDLDDPEQLAASKPMPAEERFRFSSIDRTVQIKMDAGDIWSLILAHTGTDFLETINGELSDYGLSVSGCGIHMDEKGLRLDLELFFRETRLAVKVPCTLEITGRHLSLKPAAVKLGVIPLPVGSLLSDVKLDCDLTLPVICDVNQVSFEKDVLLLTGTMEQDIRELVPPDQELYMAAVFRESLKSVADALLTREGYDALLSRLEQDSGSVEAFYRQLFILADPEKADDYLNSRHGLTQRFFPGIDFSEVEEARMALNQELTPRIQSLEQFFTAVVGEYNDKKFRLSDGEFLQRGKPFQAAKFGGKKYDDLFQVLDPEDFFLILVNVEDGYIRNTSSFYRICDEDQQFTQEVDFNRTYILGCVLRSVEGKPFVMYEAEIHEGNTYVRNITLQPLTEGDAAALQVPGKFGVWTG